jgi:dihydrofolate reductase
MNITLIAAIGQNREIGEDNKLLWDLPEDMKHFRTRTSGAPVIMGRKTFESIGRLLPKRRNIILSRNPKLKIEGAEIFSDIQNLLQTLKQDEEKEVFVIGGENIYTQFLPFATNLSITQVHAKFPNADAFFPKWDPESFKIISEKNFPVDKEHKYSFDIQERENC